MDEIMIADRSATERHQHIGRRSARPLDAGFERCERVERNAEIDRLAAASRDECGYGE
jgi:hypothetical protein